MEKKSTFKTVEDYMQPNPVTIGLDASIRDAVEHLIEHETNRLIVVDDDKKVLGMLSSWDIIRHIIPDYLENDVHLATFASEELFEKRVKEVAEDSIKKAMSGGAHTIKKEHTLIEAAILLTEKSVRLLPVIDDNDQLIGYINRTHVKNAIGDILNDGT